MTGRQPATPPRPEHERLADGIRWYSRHVPVEVLRLMFAVARAYAELQCQTR